MAGIDDLAKSILNLNGQDNFRSSGNQSDRLIYPAIVVSIDDPSEQRKIKARIISIDQDGKTVGGRDRDTLDKDLPYCIPMIQDFFHIVPIVGEMVYLLLENPRDNSAPRYWIGPQITSVLKLKYQSYKEAVKIFDDTRFYVNQKKDSKISAFTLFPGPSDVALQGRDDSDVILKQREAIMVAGKFEKDATTLTPNITCPSLIQLIQIQNKKPGELEPNNDLLPQYSQANIISTNINIYSPRGKFRDGSLKNIEKSKDLESFGELANSLHPSLYGDETIKLLDLIIRILLNHIHTPQKNLVSTADSKELEAYTLDGKLQNLLSNYVRIN